MIAVIADDFTGAAELAGIGLRYDLTVELATSVIDDPGGELLVVSTDSRSMTKREALKVISETVNAMLKLKPEFIYKKIDSVFRGHVLDELEVQLQLSGKIRALVIGANPSLGRTIKDGRYFIHDELISETDFGTDPEFAIRDSSVLQMIKAGNASVRVLKSTDKLPGTGIVFGEAAKSADVAAWAGKVDDNWMLAGAGDFFTALLDRRYKAVARPGVQLQSPHLYVSGTAFGKRREYIRRVKQQLNCVAYLPAKMMLTGDMNNEDWYRSVDDMLTQQKKAIVAIDDDEVDPWSVSAVHLRAIMATAVKRILERTGVKELFIEGGSSAAAILNELGIQKLSVLNELQRGIVRMKANDLFITVKPGSYELPDQIKRLYQ